MNRYVRLCKVVKEKGILVKKEELDAMPLDHNREYYEGVYYYNDEHFKQFNEIVLNPKTNKREPRGCSGIKDVFTDKIWFDFDNKENIESAKADAITTIDNMQTHGINPDHVEIYFSGNKGFGLVVNVDRELTTSDVYNVCVNKFATDKDGVTLKSLDSSLYDAPQIFRIPGTKHQTSGLYKVPLTYKQLKEFTVDEIKSRASNLDNIVEDFSWKRCKLPLFPKKENKSNVALNDEILDLSTKPNDWKNCKWSILQGNFKSGERHNALLVLAATCKGMGFDIDTTYYMCKSAVKKQAKRTNQEDFSKDELYKDIIENSVFKDGWTGGTYSCKKEGWLQKYCQSLGKSSCKHDTIDRETPIKLYEAKDGFIDFVKNIEENTIKTGIEILDKTMPLTTGNNCLIVGAAGSGKTALMLEILENTSKGGILTVAASLDMHRNRFFEKTIYRVSNLTRDQVYSKIKNNDFNDLMDKVKDKYKNVWFYDRSGPTVDDLKAYIMKVQEIEGKKVKLVVVDYFERINADRSDETAASKEIAGKLQDLVNDFNICLITMVQPNKFGIMGGPDQPIKNYTSIKGSSFLYQSARSIISIWRPFYTPETKELDKYMQMAILKNDLGELDLFNFNWHGRTGKITNMTEEQEDTLRRLLKEKEEKKFKAKDESWD